MDITEEIWRDVVGYERFMEVSNFGRIRKKSRQGATKFIESKLLKVQNNTTLLSVSVEGKHLIMSIPELVAKAFIPLPDGCYINDMTAITIDAKFDFSVDNIRWVNSALVNVYTRRLITEMKTYVDAEKKASEYNIKSGYRAKKSQKQNAIVQLRRSGEYVRRYIDINEILSVHPTWQREEVLKCLEGNYPDAYGWRLLYESEYEKK